ncbi:MAG: NACHT domain-containing protein [Chloroflexi bacterium]|nr:MAG: NACHT domain-containing protein [Chloroflexota bacterium]
MPDPEAQYLNTLIGELTKWQGVEEYIALQAEAEQRINSEERRIDPTLEIIRKSSKKQEEEEPQTELLKNIAEAVEKLPRFVLIGDPGAGKTTMLRYLTLEQARRRLAWLEAGRKGTPPPIPYMLYLSQWKDGQTPLVFVQSQWTLGSDLAQELQKGNVWLYLDGLNEMGARGTEKAAQLREWLKAANAPQHVIVTCRKNDYNEALDLQLDTVLVKPLEDEQIRAFAVRYLSEEKVKPFLERIFPESSWEEHRSLIHLARNPYMLAALLTVYEYQGDLPTNTGALFHTLAQVLWERERLRNTRGWVKYETMRERFGQLAFDIIDTDQRPDVSITYALERIKDEDLLRAGAGAGFIQLNQDRLHFSNQLMLEYFAAWGLQRVGVKTRIRPPEFSWLGRRRAQKWDQVVMALCGIVADANDLISHIAEVDPFLAVECIGSGVEISSTTQSLVIEKLSHVLKEHRFQTKR